MIETALGNQCWPESTDWQALAETAVSGAFAISAFAGLAAADTIIEVAIRLTDDSEIKMLNRDYREKDKATNVLSFPMLDPREIVALADRTGPEVLLGDIILALETCENEARDKGISLSDHATHLVVHGVLHLLGYDHIEEEEANAMEALERAAMANLGLADPYGV